ncbi:MAG: hypothetical protein BWY91_01732 [bacterium ADurb.BinA028]|jgi:hypothetical protein|nr:MAG: hypothetical protein BWY91_01732 [bacterium ADurb.BinA028]
MLGSLMMFASGRSVSAPSAARLSGTCCSGASRSGKADRMRPESEMSLVTTSTPVPLVNAWTIGRKE